MKGPSLLRAILCALREFDIADFNLVSVQDVQIHRLGSILRDPLRHPLPLDPLPDPPIIMVLVRVLQVVAQPVILRQPPVGMLPTDGSPSRAIRKLVSTAGYHESWPVSSLVISRLGRHGKPYTPLQTESECVGLSWAWSNGI